MSYLNNALPSNEDELEGEDKTPYRSVASRPPISDPRGINPALEDDGSGIDPQMGQDNTLRNTGLQLGSLENYYRGKDQAPPVRANVMKMIQARKAGLNPGNQAAIDRLKANGTDQMPGEVAPAEPDSTPPPPADAPPTPPAPPPTPDAPTNPPNLPHPLPGVPGMPPGGGGNLYGNLYLAGVQGSFGGMKATGENDLGNALNKQSAQNQSQMNANQIQRAKVMQAIAAQKAQQGFTAGQNDLNRANAQTLANINNTGAGTRNAATNTTSAANNAATNKTRLAVAGMKPGVNGTSPKPMSDYQNARLEQTANTNFATATKPHTAIFKSINNVTDLISAMKAGTLKSSPNIANQLATDMNIINSASSTVSGTDHARIQSLMGHIKGLYSYLMGDATNTIPQGQLDNLSAELDVLRHSNTKSFKTAVKSLQAGTSNPMMKNVYQQRHDSILADQYSPAPSNNIIPSNTDVSPPQAKGGRPGYTSMKGPDGTTRSVKNEDVEEMKKKYGAEVVSE